MTIGQCFFEMKTRNALAAASLLQARFCDRP